MSNNISLMVSINECQKLVEDFRDRFLVHMFQEILDNSRLWSEDVWEKQLLLSADQERNELAEVTREDRVKFLISLDELEESLEKNIFISFLLIFFIKGFSSERLLRSLS